MNLSPDDVSLFFRLMWALQAHVNRQLGLLPQVKTAEAYGRVPSEEKLTVREQLYQRMDLLDKFVAENPANLTPEELQVVRSWKHYIAGKFYILRFLKRYTIFISAEKGENVYGVLGLIDPLEDVLYPFPPPVLAEAVLLPFKGRIIYDGLLRPYSISFGPGIRGDLNEAYQRAKQKNAIIESLEPDAESARPPKPRKPKHDWRPVLDNLVETTEQLRQAETAVQTRAFGVLKASARLAQAAAHDLDNLEELSRLTRRTRTALRQLETALYREGGDEL